MNSKYLLGVSLAMIVVAALGLGVFYVMRGGLPPVPDYDWPRSAGGKRLENAQQRAAVEALRAKATGTVRFLAGKDAVRRFDNVKLEKPTDTKRGDGRDPDELDFNAGYDTRGLFESARFHATTAIVLFWVVFACGLLGLARLKVRHLVAVGGGVLVLALLGGGALLIFTGATTLAGILLTIMLLGFFGQLVAANLLPDANHPFVVQAEDTMRALTPEQRRAYTAKRFIGGIFLIAIGGALTVATIAIGAGRVVVVPTGAIAIGLFSMATPLIASIRLKLQG